jgi:hypothetical protein|tara:strand:+ start:873 stop:1034 length:162 start_codon:yes stop_codon:yes gene_type:complete
MERIKLIKVWQEFLDLVNELLRQHKFLDDNELGKFYEKFNLLAEQLQEHIYNE